MTSTRPTFALAVVLCYAIGFRVLVIDRPFHFDIEGYGSFYGIMAQNYLRFPIAQTHGMPVLNSGSSAHKPPVFYSHHPPIVPLLIVPAYALWGFGEWQTRLPSSIATIAAIYALFVLVGRVSTRRTASIAAALFAAMPMNLYFGGLPEVVGMPMVLFALLSVLAYVRFHADPRPGTLLTLAAAFALAGICDWPAFVLVPILLVHFVSTKPRDRWPWIAVFCVISGFVFALIYAYITVATASSWDWMFPIFQGRSRIGVRAPFSLKQWLVRALETNVARHTIPLLLTSLVWMMTNGLRSRTTDGATTVARLLLAWGLVHVLLAREAVYIHQWWWWPLSPAIAVSAALVVERMTRAAADRLSPLVASATVTVMIALFATWTAATSYRELSDRSDELFSSVELGNAIKAAAPGPDDVAVLVWSGGAPQIWFSISRSPGRVPRPASYSRPTLNRRGGFATTSHNATHDASSLRRLRRSSTCLTFRVDDSL